MPTCLHCSSAFQITSEDQRFLDLFAVPSPRSCPTCRLQRRLCERNTRSLYYRKCDLTGKQIIAQYNPECPFPVYGVDAFMGDGWSGLTYGREVDFNRPFFDQFKELTSVVPHLALFNTPGTLENSDYNNCTGYIKNCYLLSESDICEDCYYSNLLKKCKNVVDCSVCYECERCYECIDCVGCQMLRKSQDCQQCSDSFFLFNCQGCTDCIGCINQRHKQYMIFNTQYSKEEYEVKKAALGLNSRSGLQSAQEQSEGFFLSHPHRALLIERAEGCTGDRIYDAKGAADCFDVKDIEDCRNCQKISLGCKSCMDFNSWGQNSELVYQCSACGDRTYNVKFCSNCITVSNAEYSFECFHSKNIFGCVGLKGKEYCILNKQYSKADYEALRSTLIAHMRQSGEYGEYFPMDLCPFAYNESFAPDLFPMTKEEALKRGWRWYEGAEAHDRYLGAHFDLPETIAEVKDGLSKKILLCEASKKPFKIIPQELAFYRSMDLPAPTLCPDERHRRRMAKRNPYRLWERKCAKCSKAIQTTYSPDRSEKIFCDDCYLKTVY
ncbi:MAG: hypothetical protein PHZ00_04205 [Candidatus Peribacteraceae bacterium]|nr:hypothetical protein [Candidatus Peribacteraceae bacterium]